MFVTSYSVAYCIFIPETGNLFSLFLCSWWWVQKVEYVFGLQIVFVCGYMYITPSHYHHCANLSEDIKLIKCMSDIFCRVCVRLSIFSQLSIIQYMGLCVFSLPISLVMIERLYTLSYYHHQIGSMNYYLLFRVRSWNNGSRCMSFYILIHIYIHKRPPQNKAKQNRMISNCVRFNKWHTTYFIITIHHT